MSHVEHLDRFRKRVRTYVALFAHLVDRRLGIELSAVDRFERKELTSKEKKRE